MSWRLSPVDEEQGKVEEKNEMVFKNCWHQQKGWNFKLPTQASLRGYATEKRPIFGKLFFSLKRRKNYAELCSEHFFWSKDRFVSHKQFWGEQE